MAQTVAEKCDELQEVCLGRLCQLRGTLDSAERRVTRNDGILNCLGEIQAEANMLDCCLASLGTLRQMRDGDQGSSFSIPRRPSGNSLLAETIKEAMTDAERQVLGIEKDDP